ncbi:2-dehydro-3-deoxygalactonokinase [Sphingosinicella sp. LY1275]|uniref:2-dehydro-3-deoxygalactonokinase n=1 Tax=Sphingosinicella sp. LY1275 TaxID=3095379 RepID=UPI002ADEB22B|nr:2-dehydro-3-deoxygalactonokinase [Sphingosinicella sp. LY1275]MEA1015661.1 2-dehydro-3-deoxygalactonokinase [Sphingosinicella sp. LY1275]
MRWAEGFIAVDWGTTNRRAYLIGPDGRLADEMEDDRGVTSVPADGFPAAVAEIRARLGDRPLMMAGMIGSNRGWREAPYVPCPAGLPDLVVNLLWVEPGRTAIVPGVCQSDDDNADVMRGEEVQLLGAYGDGMIPADALCCHPGTHNKWARIADGRIASFRTVMTGELFSLLSEHSILADLMAGPVEAGPAFEAGVRHGLAHDDLPAELFSVRARYLLGKAPREDAADYTSGLLIGCDVRIGLDGAAPGEVVVMGRPELTGLVAAALAIAGRTAREIDGEEAFLAGIRHLAELTI